MKISQLIVAAGLAAASLVGFGGSVSAAPAGSTNAVIPACVDGVLATVTDDSGVQHQACVASAAADPATDPAAPTPTPATAKSTLLSQPVPTTGAATGPAQLPRTGAGTGGLVIAALLVGSGSIASLLSRRKADRR